MASIQRSLRPLSNTLSCQASSSRSIPLPLPLPRLPPPRTTRMPLSQRQTIRHASTLSPTQTTNTGSSLASLSPAERSRLAMHLSRKRVYDERAARARTIMLYSTGCIVLSLGVTYAAVPLYRAFCSATGFSGVPITDPARFSPDRLYVTPQSEQRKRITVHFEATSADTLPWKFEPVTRSVDVLPGETALAFYTAKNMGKEDLIGIATYNMTPEKIAPYFAKVECFCFEEQKIRAGEEVDLPVFFFIDRDILDEPQLDGLDDVVLSYTFFKARRNTKGHLVPDASEADIQKSQGFDKYEHARVVGERGLSAS